MVKPNKKSIITRLWRFIKNFKWLLILACFIAIVKSVSSLAIVAVSRWLLNNYQSLSGSQLKLISYCVFGYFSLFIIIVYFRGYLPVYISSNVIKGMRQQLYRHLQRLSADFYIQHKTGEIVSRITNDITVAQLMFSTVFIDTVFDVITLTVSVGYVVATYPFQIYYPVLVICLVYAVMVRIFLPKIRHVSRQVQEEMGKITGNVSENIVGMKILQSFTQENRISHIMDERLESHYSETLRMAKLKAFFSSANQTLPGLARFLVIIIGISLIVSSKITVGDITGLILVLGHLFFPLNRSAETTFQIGMSLGSLDRVFNFFDEQPMVKEAKHPLKLKKIKGDIHFKNVCFRYLKENEPFILKKISFDLKAGSKIAFVGPSGAGKSTMMDLISRFYDPDEGNIFIDGYDIRRMSLKFLRENIGVVMQDTILFTGTIAENVRIGKPDAQDHEVIESLKNAYAWDFVKEMKFGVESIVGERGVTLSGGQKQRIALARVFLKNPKILILDEATSALDSESEFIVQKALQNLTESRTTLMIAHRLSSINNTDQIYFLDNGEIIECGSKKELLARNGPFQKFHNQQSLMLDYA
jgi:subfamily B ATP-binding cassette protein MsbA